MNYLFEIIKENAVIIIAGLALLLTVWQGWQTRKHNRLSVKPLLKITSDGSKPHRVQWLELKIINQGLGPAIIKNFILQFDGKELTRNNYRSHLRKLNEKLEGRGNEVLKMGFLISDSVLKMGESNLLLNIKYDSEIYNMDSLKKIDILVEYYSIYKDKTFTCSTKDIRLPDVSKSQ